MWSSLVLLQIILVIYASADLPLVFPKCCPDSQFLVRKNNALDPREYFECVDDFLSLAYWNVSVVPLTLGANVKVKVGFPKVCEEYEMFEPVTDTRDSETDFCYDRLISDVINGTFHKISPHLIALHCRLKGKGKEDSFEMFQIRKCCPNGQAYNISKHLCQDDEGSGTIFEHLDRDGVAVFEVDYGLHCKIEEYTIEMSSDQLDLKIYGSTLTANRLDSKRRMVTFAKGEWCVEKSAMDAKGLVARGCSQQCSSVATFCLRKCCPAGQHFRPRQCGRVPSDCVTDIDGATAINLSYYIRNNKDDYDFDTMGFRSALQCPHGKFVVNRSNPEEAHYLSTSGHMMLPSLLGGETSDYCIESFDHRHCGGEIKVETLACFIPLDETKKNFTISFAMNTISCLFLALTLVVYIALSELRNLHGRTLLCHVATMLIAYGCLARVQYGKVDNNLLCRFLGYGIYFGFVAAFCWLNVMCFDIWWTFGSMRVVQSMRKASALRRRFLWYSLYAWSVSVLLTLAMLLLDLFPFHSMLDANIGQGICWFGSLQNSASDWPHYIFFVIPMGIVVCTNFVFWVLTARHCNRVQSEVHRLQAGSTGDRTKKRFKADRARYLLTVKLWVVMGAGWVWELLSTVVTEPPWLWNTLDRINELQGLSIFLILVMKPKVYFLVRKKLGLDKETKQKNGTTTSARTSSSFLSRSISNDEKSRIYPTGGLKKK